jgi:3-oxoadipate enol-lactonase
MRPPLSPGDPVRLHADVEGPGDTPAVVLAPSLGTTLAMWRPQVQALSRHFRVVRYNHRGHGSSPVPPGPYDLDDLVGDVLCLLDDLGMETAHVCGLSLGGMVAMRLAAVAPERVGRLVLLCTSAHLGPAEAWAERAATIRAEGTAAVADIVVGLWFTPAWAATHPDVMSEMRATLADTSREVYACHLEAIGQMNLLDDLPRIGAQTLVVAGADDLVTPPEHARSIVERLPAARLEILSPAAHLANVEQPQTVTRLLLEHLRGER